MLNPHAFPAGSRAGKSSWVKLQDDVRTYCKTEPRNLATQAQQHSELTRRRLTDTIFSEDPELYSVVNVQSFQIIQVAELSFVQRT